MITQREYLMQSLSKLGDNCFRKYGRDGNPADLFATMAARSQELKVLQDPDPSLDKQIVENEGDIGICLVGRRRLM